MVSGSNTSYNRMLASLHMKVCLYLHFCLPGIWPSSTANESDHTEELYFGPVLKGSNWYFCCCFVLANLVSSVKVTSGFQVNRNICFLCQIQTPAWKRGGWRKMRTEIYQIMCHRASERVMAVPTFILFIYLFFNTRAKGHQMKLPQSRLEQRKWSFTHWVKLWQPLLQKAVCNKVQ